MRLAALGNHVQKSLLLTCFPITSSRLSEAMKFPQQRVRGGKIERQRAERLITHRERERKRGMGGLCAPLLLLALLFLNGLVLLVGRLITRAPRLK